MVLYFTEFKPLVLTNKNLEFLDECFPNLDVTNLGGHRFWLHPVDLEVACEDKQIVRIEPLQTMRLQPDPSKVAAEDTPGQGIQGGEGRFDDTPAPSHDDNNPF